jgi:phosphate starvation-inducible protein PhoH
MTLKTKSKQTKVADKIVLSFEDNSLLPGLFGAHDEFLARIEQTLGANLSSRGNKIVLTGEEVAILEARDVLLYLYRSLEAGDDITIGDVDGALRLAQAPPCDLATGQCGSCDDLYLDFEGSQWPLPANGSPTVGSQPGWF